MGKHLESYKVLIGKKIQRRRIEMGFTNQGELASKVGTDQSQVSRWESGKNMPEGQLRAGLAQLLEVDDSFFELIEMPAEPAGEPEQASRAQRTLDLLSKLNAISDNDFDAVEMMTNNLFELAQRSGFQSKKVLK